MKLLRPVALLFLLFTLSSSLAARDLLYNATGLVAEDIGGDFTLNGPQGSPVSLSDFQGKLVLLYFGYTSCPDICPSSLSIMQRTMRGLGKDAGEVQGIFVSVDPARDGGARLQEYARYFHPSFIGLEGSEAQTRAAARQWNVSYQKEQSDSAAGYLIAHSDYIYLLDREGELAALFNSKSRHGELVGVIRKLLEEKPMGLFEKLFQ
jgi:protein SCO1/2